MTGEIIGIISGVLGSIAAILTIWTQRIAISELHHKITSIPILKKSFNAIVDGVYIGIFPSVILVLLCLSGSPKNISEGWAIGTIISVSILFGMGLSFPSKEDEAWNKEERGFVLRIIVFSWVIGFFFGSIGVVLHNWLTYAGFLMLSSISSSLLNAHYKLILKLCK